MSSSEAREELRHTDDNVVASYISSEPQQALREFCRYIRSVLRTQFSAS